jgi:gliding motility-associated-like protein
MIRKLLYLSILILLLIAQFSTYATHNRAGEITYKQTGPLSFQVTVITFTNTLPTSDGTLPADREYLTIEWGDNTYIEVRRSEEIPLPDGYKKNIYVAEHTYPASGTFKILVEDPNRNEGVKNIPNSISTIFSISTILIINPQIGSNNAPIFLNPPVDQAAVGKVFIHNPSVYDPDGDSISYKLTVCTGENGEPISNYSLPESSNRPISIDSVSGDLIWDSPTEAGAFNIAFLIEEWRYGVKIGQITRDMQIEVFDSENNPPYFDTLSHRCIEALSTLEHIVEASDPDGDLIELSAFGGVFEVDSPAVFYPASASNPANGTLMWETYCHHIRQQAYSVVFKANDLNEEVSLVDQENMEIKVLGPPPTILDLTPTHNQISISWDNYACPNITEFTIYRSTTPYEYPIDSCTAGIPSYTGFKAIATIADSMPKLYIDNNNGNGLPQGYTYCYRIEAVFENKVRSKSSDEYCTELIRGVPIITNVSVLEHHNTEGEIYLAWSKPLELDTIKFPPPYQYIIKRSNGFWGENLIAIDTLFSLNDTIYYDKGINTTSSPFSYSVEIHNSEGITAQPMIASSIFPSINGSDNTLVITAEKNVPWKNNLYTLYKKDEDSGIYDSIANSLDGEFTDSNLINGQNYCYQITSSGAYDLPFITKPLINHSHKNCGIPIDTIPSSPPILDVSSFCDNYYNLLNWKPAIPNEEITGYNIYYTLLRSQELVLLDSIRTPDSLSYIHSLSESLAACYAVTSLDSAQNESDFSTKICIDECSYYQLPNAFTPNGDDINDMLVPITPRALVEKYIEKVDFKLYSRWGDLVYETENPMIEWNGMHLKQNKLVTPGVYYYVCDVYEKRISGVESRYLYGFIHVFHNNEKVSNEK